MAVAVSVWKPVLAVLSVPCWVLDDEPPRLALVEATPPHEEPFSPAEAEQVVGGYAGAATLATAGTASSALAMTTNMSSRDTER